MKALLLFCFFCLLFPFSKAHAQLDSIEVQGTWRNFIVHIPAGYSPIGEYPLVLNLHGLNSNAAQQAAYSQFDQLADTAGFVVVYPNAVNSSWAVNGNTDVDFLAALVDSLREDYALNNCLFLTGMSQGAFMSYKFACAFSDKVTAVGVVAGNMAQSLQASCVSAQALPVMHLHGTDDPLVGYNGTFGIPPVETTVQWWVNHNQCAATPDSGSFPDVTTTDNCTADYFYYTGGVGDTEVRFIRINGGGHTWPGALPIPPFGNTSQDIQASNLIGSFFKSFCTNPTGATEKYRAFEWRVFPNPAQDRVFLKTQGQATGRVSVVIGDVFGKPVRMQTFLDISEVELDLSTFASGLYSVCLVKEDGWASCRPLAVLR